MATSPYDPPRSAVADFDAERHPGQRPRPVWRAVVLLWSSLGIGIVIWLLEFNSGAYKNLPGWAVWTMPAIVLGITAALTLCIYAGYNWARIVFLALFLLGALPYLGVLAEMFERSKVTASLSMLQLLLQAAAVYFVFTKPGSLWFRAK
jgi:hypothetical protein